MESGEDRAQIRAASDRTFDEGENLDSAIYPPSRSRLGRSPSRGRVEERNGFGQKRDEALRVYGEIGEAYSRGLKAGTEREALRNYRASIAENQALLVEGNVLSAKDIHAIMAQVQETLSDPEMGNMESNESPVSIMRGFLNEE